MALLVLACGSSSARGAGAVVRRANEGAPAAARSEAPGPVVLPAEPPTYEALLERESATAPLLVRELEPGGRTLHLVLDAERCYRIVAVADRSIALELRDEHGHRLAAERGRVVRFASICPRWTSSFELRVDLVGDRGRVSVSLEDQPSASSRSVDITRSMTR